MIYKTGVGVRGKEDGKKCGGIWYKKEDTSQTDGRKDLFLPADGSEELGT